MKILFFHGFESTLPSSKAEWMEHQGHIVYAHPMQYSKKNAFHLALECAKQFNPDLIVGSSMGGYFAFHIGTHLPTKLVLLNPALHGRSKEFERPKNGKYQPEIWALLGKNDALIDPFVTVEKLKNLNAKITIGEHEHRTPLEIFLNYMKNNMFNKNY